MIHTPSVSATKWWIGGESNVAIVLHQPVLIVPHTLSGAAQTATHCAVFAQLIVKGQIYGTHTFITPLRDPK